MLPLAEKIVIFLAEVIVILAVHEAGHAVVMMKFGIRIKEMSIGVGPALTLRLRRVPFPVKLAPGLLIAYVAPEEGEEVRIRKLPYRDQAYIYGAGVLANLWLGCLGVVVIGTAAMLLPSGNHRWGLYNLVGGLALGGTVWLLRRPVASYVLPLLGAFLLGFMLWSLWRHSPAVSTPVEMIWDHGISPMKLLLLGPALSLSVAIFNCLPVFFVDGGRIAEAVLVKISGRLAGIWRTVSGVLFLSIIVYGWFSQFSKG